MLVRDDVKTPLLDTFRQKYEEKQAETDKAIRKTKHRDMMRCFRDFRNELENIRDELKSITDVSLKKSQFIYIDDIISFPIVIMLMKKIKSINASMLKPKLRKENINNADEMIDRNYQGQLTESLAQFKKWLIDAKKIDDESINEFIARDRAEIRFSLADGDKGISDKLENIAADILTTDMALTYLIDIFERADHRHMKALDGTLAPNTIGGYLTTGTSFYSLFKGVSEAELDRPFAILPLLMRCVKQTPGTKALWPELQLWLEGVHHYHANLLKIKLDKDSKSYTTDQHTGVVIMPEGRDYPYINEVDQLIQKMTKKTFYHLALHILEASHVLGNILSPGSVRTMLPASCFFTQPAAARVGDSEALTMTAVQASFSNA